MRQSSLKTALRFLKRLNRITIWFSNFNAFSYIPKRNENICPHKNWYTDICSSIFLSSQNVETTQMLIWWTDKIWYILYSETKRNQLLIHATIWMNLENIMPSERSLSQNATYFMIPFTWNIQKRQISRQILVVV